MTQVRPHLIANGSLKKYFAGAPAPGQTSRFSMTQLSKPRLRIAPRAVSRTARIAMLIAVGMWLIAICLTGFLLPPSSAAADESPGPAETVVRQMIDSIRK